MSPIRLNTRWADDFSEFFGREKELKALGTYFKSHALVTICGSGGVGKTRLALRYCESIENERPFFRCDLSKVKSAQGFYEALHQGLELKEKPATGDVVIAHLLTLKNVFLLLDHFDNALQNAASCVVELSTRVRSLSMLITSRERLNIESEALLRLEPFEQIKHARALFFARAQKQIGECEPKDVDALLVALEKIPLAIVLAAAQMTLYSPKEILEKSADIHFLKTKQRDIVERHRSLVASIDASFSTLNKKEKDLIIFTSLFTGPFSLNDLLIFDADAAPSLSTLLSRSLINRIKSDGPPRFCAFEATRRFLYLHFLEMSDNKQESMLNKAAQSTLQDKGLYAQKGLFIYQAMLERKMHANASDLAFHLAKSFMREGPAQKALDIYSGIVSASSNFDPSTRALAHLRRARYRLVYGGVQVKDDLAAALKLNAKLNRDFEMAQTQALYERRLGDASKAQLHYARAAELAPSASEKARIWSDAAGHAFEIEDFDATVSAFEKALSFACTPETRGVQAEIHTNYALFHQAQGAFEGAETLLLDALSAHQASQNRRYEGITFGDLAGLAFEEGLYVKALPLYERALEILGELGDVRHASLLESARSACLRVLGQKGQSREPASGSHLEHAAHIYASILSDEVSQAPADEAQSDEARLAERIKKRVEKHRKNASLRVSVDAQTFCIDDKRYECAKRPLLSRILLALVYDAFTKRSPALSKDELIAKGWPNEKADAESSLNRLYVALSALRKKGLKNAIEASDGHYRLSQSESAFIVQDS